MSDRLDINTASVEELAALPGLGGRLATRIVERRSSSGPFSSLEDLRSIKGVGGRTLSKLEARVWFGPTGSAPLDHAVNDLDLPLWESESGSESQSDSVAPPRSAPTAPDVIVATGTVDEDPSDDITDPGTRAPLAAAPAVRAAALPGPDTPAVSASAVAGVARASGPAILSPPTASMPGVAEAAAPPASKTEESTEQSGQRSLAGSGGGLRLVHLLGVGVGALLLMLLAVVGIALSPTGEDGSAGVPPPPQLIVLIDRSENMQAHTGEACAALDAALARYLEPGSSAFALRDKRTEIEVYLTPTPEVSGPMSLMTLSAADFMTSGGLEATRSAREAAVARRQEARAEAVARCEEAATPAPVSSIHAAIASLVSDMAMRCTDGQICELVVYSDLFDADEPWLCAEVHGDRMLGPGGACRRSDGPAGTDTVGASTGELLPTGVLVPTDEDGERVWPPELVTPATPAEGIAVRVCGISDSRVGASAMVGPRVAQRRHAVWSSLFPGATLEILNHCEFM